MAVARTSKLVPSLLPFVVAPVPRGRTGRTCSRRYGKPAGGGGRAAAWLHPPRGGCAKPLSKGAPGVPTIKNIQHVLAVPPPTKLRVLKTNIPNTDRPPPRARPTVSAQKIMSLVHSTWSEQNSLGKKLLEEVWGEHLMRSLAHSSQTRPTNMVTVVRGAILAQIMSSALREAGPLLSA